MTTNDSPAQPSPRPIRVTAFGKTDVGRMRDHNEDRLLVRPALDLFVVADGMGGHNAGEVASALAAVSLENFFAATRHAPAPAALLADSRTMSDDARRLVAGVRKANADIFEISKTRPEHKGMGTTVVAVHVSPEAGEIHIAHVGDSRGYRVRDGKIEQLTRDHSLQGDAMAWKPDITEKELNLLPKNVISRALGRQLNVEVDLRTEEARPGDVYLVCSDGLSGMVGDQLMLDITLHTPDGDELCDTLIALANEEGGTDNITVLVIRVEAAT